MKKSRKRKPLTEEQKLKRQQSAFKRKIKGIFAGAGFNYLATNDHEMTIGLRKVEIDSIYIYENIWLLCEDTIKTSEIRDHIRIKNEAFGQIKQNLPEYIQKMKELFPDRNDLLCKYDADRIKIFCLYISRDELILSDDDYLLFENLLFVQPKTLEYFQWIVKCIKYSARNEIFRFLKLTSDQIGMLTSSSDSKQILSLDEKAIQEYVKFCATVLRSYFGALRKNFKSFWDNENSKLLSVISINGFIIALTRQLSVNGIHDFDYYDKKFNNLNIDFSKEQFPYTSSQYRKFSSQILTEAFGLDPSLY